MGEERRVAIICTDPTLSGPCQIVIVTGKQDLGIPIGMAKSAGVDFAMYLKSQGL